MITDFSSESATTPWTVPLKLSSVLMFGFLSAVFTLAVQKSVATLPVCVFDVSEDQPEGALWLTVWV